MQSSVIIARPVLKGFDATLSLNLTAIYARDPSPVTEASRTPPRPLDLPPLPATDVVRPRTERQPAQAGFAPFQTRFQPPGALRLGTASPRRNFVAVSIREPRRMTRVIEARAVAKDYPYGGEAVHALRGVSMAVDAGEWISIVGPSGCGKSSLLNVLAGIDAPSSGTVDLLGRPLHALGEGERSRLRLREVGFVFQRFHLLAVLTALENVELPMAEAGVAKAERRDRARKLLEYVGLGHRTKHRPPHLSGGEQQRVAIARALANRPKVLFADEPTGELDRRTGEEILALFQRVNGEGTTMVMVTHDPGVAARAGRMVEMADGRVVRDRTTQREG
jgi:putative ABC transport system ATP-binding protein